MQLARQRSAMHELSACDPQDRDLWYKSMTEYYTIADYAEVEQIIEKSKFIGYIMPVDSREEADFFISEVKAMHKTATHNVPAFIIGPGSELKWASDDKEPSGTAGAPILQLLSGQKLTNTVVVVTRYFGGVKLGTGGLARAYSSTAALAVEKAGIAIVKEMSRLKFSLNYSLYGKLKNMEQGGNFTIENADFSENVHMTVKSDPQNALKLIGTLSELTSGGCNENNIMIEKFTDKIKI